VTGLAIGLGITAERWVRIFGILGSGSASLILNRQFFLSISLHILVVISVALACFSSERVLTSVYFS
jgi:hypothetical protein